MAQPPPPPQPPPVTVVTGTEELLVARAVRAVVVAVAAPAQAPTAQAPTAQAPTAQTPTAQAPTAQTPTAQTPTAQTPTAQTPTAQTPTAQAPTGSTVELRDLDAADLQGPELAELSSPSLFPEPRVLVLRGADELAPEHRPRLLEFAADPLPDTYLVLTLPGGARGKGLIDSLVAAGAQLVACKAPSRPRERWEFVQAEVAALGAQVTAGACRALVEAVGADLRQLATVTAQLVADSPGLIDEHAVARYHRGRAETRGFDVTDAALAGDLSGAMALLGSAVESGLSPVVITATFASGLRDLAAVRAANGPPAAVASALRMPPWKVDKVLRTARGWTDDSLAAAVRSVAATDAEVKGGAADPVYAVERLVVQVARQRGAR